MGDIMEQNWFTIKQLFPNVYGIAEFGHFEKVISYLFIGNKKALLFDSGLGIGNIRNVISSLTKNEVILVNSHCHFDHIGGNTLFSNIFLLDNKFSKEKSKNGYTKKDLEKYNAADLAPIKPFSYMSLIHNGDEIDIEPFSFKVIHTPGHTPDSICLFEKSGKILLTGDTLYPSPIYLQFKESNENDYINSLKKLLFLDINTILPAHNEFTISAKYIKEIIKFFEGKTTDRKEIKIDEIVSILRK